MAMHKRRFNHGSVLLGSALVPAATGDRYWGQDLARDNNYLRGLVGRMMQKLVQSNTSLLSGGLVTEGSSKTKVNITAAAGFALVDITVGDDDASWAVPQATETAQIPVLVESEAQTDFDISGATLDGVTVNYIKLRYKDLDVNTRTKKYKVESFAFSIADSFEIIANSTAPNDYDVVLASFVGNGTSTLTITQAGTAIVPRATSAVSASTATSAVSASTATSAGSADRAGYVVPIIDLYRSSAYVFSELYDDIMALISPAPSGKVLATGFFGYGGQTYVIDYINFAYGGGIGFHGRPFERPTEQIEVTAWESSSMYFSHLSLIV